jgi:hypothetical protein
MKLSLKVPARFAPRKPRAAVAIEAVLLLPDDRVVTIAIRNISADGFMCETPEPIPVDAAIGVALPGCGIVPARVRWCGEGEIGAQFRRPLDLDRLQQATAAPDRALFATRILEGPY